jgi:hypothetical protein
VTEALKWRVHPTPSGEQKGRILKGGILKDFSVLAVSRSPFSWEKFLLYFHFLLHNKSLLNSVTIFLPPNSFSSREKEFAPLDGNRKKLTQY